MKAELKNRAVATHTYIIEAEEGEVLTPRSIEAFLDAKDLAPFGCYIVYNTGEKAEVQAYVD